MVSVGRCAVGGRLTEKVADGVFGDNALLANEIWFCNHANSLFPMIRAREQRIERATRLRWRERDGGKCRRTSLLLPPTHPPPRTRHALCGVSDETSKCVMRVPSLGKDTATKAISY